MVKPMQRRSKGSMACTQHWSYNQGPKMQMSISVFVYRENAICLWRLGLAKYMSDVIH